MLTINVNQLSASKAHDQALYRARAKLRSVA